MNHLGPVIALALLAPAAAIGQVPASPAPPESGGDTVAGIRAIYDSGFRSVAATLPPSAADSTTLLYPLWLLARFREQSVAWLRVTGGAYQPVTPGPHRAAWLVVVPAGTATVGRMRSLLQRDPSAGVVVGQIAAAPVTPAWAGVFVFRVLALLYPYADEDMRPRSAAELAREQLQASDMELMAADLLARGDYRDSLDAALQRWHADAPDRLTDSVINVPPAVLRRIEAAVPAEPARSREESDLRDEAATTSLVIRFCELHALAMDACATVQARLLLMNQAGLGRRSSSPER